MHGALGQLINKMGWDEDVAYEAKPLLVVTLQDAIKGEDEINRGDLRCFGGDENAWEASNGAFSG